jgi:hypothetical protein
VRQRVVIERRFRGPPDSAQGGYACGLVAELVPGHCAAVRLHQPPPLERPLDLTADNDGTVKLLDSDRLVAEGVPVELTLDVRPAVSLDEARSASVRSPWVERHPFPGCFGCGPERSQDEAVAITMGSVLGTDVFAAPWTPLDEFADGGAAVAARFVWAALDCPTAAPAVPPDAPACVLGLLSGRLVAPVRPRLAHAVVAWSVEHDGRKHRGAAAIYGPDGELCACSEGLWIELRDPRAMGART